MCGRFSLTKEELEIEKRFNAKFYTNDLVKRYNVAPGQLALVITCEKPGELQFYKWGLVPSWAKDVSIGNKMINAKSETIFEKPSFKNLIRRRRCLVISDGFYEWESLPGKRKLPHRIGLKDDALFAMAGLWDKWTDKQTGEILPTFTVITTVANNVVSPFHDRMPVILQQQDEEKWLNLKTTDEDLVRILTMYPADLMKRYTVSELVNSPKNDTAEIIVPHFPGTLSNPELF